MFIFMGVVNDCQETLIFYIIQLRTPRGDTHILILYLKIQIAIEILKNVVLKNWYSAFSRK